MSIDWSNIDKVITRALSKKRKYNQYIGAKRVNYLIDKKISKFTSTTIVKNREKKGFSKEMNKFSNSSFINEYYD